MMTENKISHITDTSYSQPIKKLPRNQNKPKVALNNPKPVAFLWEGNIDESTALTTDSCAAIPTPQHIIPAKAV